VPPLIGISVALDRGRRLRAGADYFYVRRAYSQAVLEAGGTPLLLGLDTPASAATRLCDGFVITGGDDLPRSFQTALPTGSAYPEDAERIAWDRALFDHAQHADKYVLGVCYGMQLLNLHYGGTLYEQLSREVSNPLDHGGGGHTSHHGVELSRSRLFEGLPPTLVVNSSHRQAVADVAPAFVATARSSDGVVEAIEHGRCFGVEWHPETDPGSVGVYRNFVRLVSGQ
jgi:putative glutamine amidotransferase